MADKPAQLDPPVADQKKLGWTFQDRVIEHIRTAARKILPEGVFREVQRYRGYKGKERRLYVETRMLNGLGFANSTRGRPPRTARSFVFVCFGNIMRSPMCEALMKRELARFPQAGISVASAGLNAIPGTAAHPWAVLAAHDFGISLENHRAKLLTPEMVDQSDVILFMDIQNQVQLLSRHPRARHKMFMLSAYVSGDRHAAEIDDPYYAGQEGTRICYQILNDCIQNLTGTLLP